MDTFFCSTINLGLCLLSQEESHHAARVLRKKVGVKVRLIDGQGRSGTGIFEAIHKKSCAVKIESLEDEAKPLSVLDIAIAPTKSLDRLEWFLEKSTELGVHQFLPILCKHAERKIIRLDRLEKVVRSATKQSLRVFLPQISALTPFEALLENLSENYDARYIAYCGEGPNVDISSLSKQAGNTLVLIGPEGDFSSEEYALARQKGFLGLTLGTSRLRTETAGIYVAAAFRFLSYT